MLLPFLGRSKSTERFCSGHTKIELTLSPEIFFSKF